MKKKNSNIINTLLRVICVITFICLSGFIIYLEYDEYKEQKIFDKLKIEQSQKQEKIAVQVMSETEKDTQKQTVLPAYEKLYKENDDLYAWIKIADTVINYPVMHTPDDPNFYIHKNWNKEESTQGSIYVDGRCGAATENLIIYGHNMKNRTMFGSLMEYKEKSYFENHKYIEFNTIYEEAKYEIIAVSKAVIYYDEEPPEGEYLFYEHVELDSKEDFDAYIQNAMANAYYETGSTAEYGDKLITLCTCDYWTENARLIIIAKKV